MKYKYTIISNNVVSSGGRFRRKIRNKSPSRLKKAVHLYHLFYFKFKCLSMYFERKTENTISTIGITKILIPIQKPTYLRYIYIYVCIISEHFNSIIP